MSYKIEQKIGKNTYIYEVVSYWDKDKKQPRQRRKYLGKKDPETGEAIPPKEPSQPQSSQGFGAVNALHQIAQSTGLEQAVKQQWGDKAPTMLLWCYYQLLDSQPTAYRFADWCERHHLPYDTQHLALDSSSISEWMQSLGESDTQRYQFLQTWIQQLQSERGVWFDITSVSSYSQNNDWVEWGYNRDRENLPQINLGLVMDAQHQLPLSYEVYPGSINDVTTLMNVIDKHKAWGLTANPLILDRGFYSAANLSYLNDQQSSFIMPLPNHIKQAKALIEATQDDLHSPEANFIYQGQPLFSVARTYQLKDMTLYAQLYFDEQRYAEQSKRFYQRLNEVEAHVHQANFDNVEQITEAMESAWRQSSRYFQIELIDQQAYLTRQPEAIKASLNYFGKFILISNQSYSASELLSLYRQRDAVEKAFGTIKQDLSNDRLRVHSTQAMHGKILLTFISSILYLSLQNRLQQSQLAKRYTIQQVIDQLNKLQVIHLDQEQTLLTELSKKQRGIFKGLGLKIPTVPSY